jgi:hypothetical protein
MAALTVARKEPVGTENPRRVVNPWQVVTRHAHHILAIRSCGIAIANRQ